MRRIAIAVVMTAAIACGGDSTAPDKKAPKPDPYVTIRVTNALDTTRAPGRSGWSYFLILSGPQVNQNGISPTGGSSLSELRRGTTYWCMSVAADSVGQRFITPFAISDTLHRTFVAADVADSIIHRWALGNHSAPPSGLMIITRDSIDAWNSQQYADGHGLTRADPIKWSWNLTGVGAATFTERTAADTTGCNTY